MNKIGPEQRDFSDERLEEVHGIVLPADVRHSDHVNALVRKLGTNDAHLPIQVWKLSPLGIELISDYPSPYSSGDRLDIQLAIGGHTGHFEGLVVTVISKNTNQCLIGARLSKKALSSHATTTKRRRGSRWICSEQFDPVCMAANPVQFNDFLYFKIRDISSSGMRAITSLRNKFIVPGMELDAQISFPLTSQISIPLKVARVNLTAEGGKDYLEVGLEFGELNNHHKEVIGQYLVQFSDAESLRSVRESGFFPTSLTKGIDYGFIKTAEEFQEVLELRFLANKRVGKIPEGYTAYDMADIYDARSRILVGRYRGKVVGTLRLTFNELVDKLEHENYVELPPEFPRGELVLECARAATHPDFRGSDLWNTLVQHAAIAAGQAKRPWVVLSTTKELLPMYLRIGFTDTGLRYRHELYPEMEQLVLYINMYDALSGHGVGPIYWNVIWRNVGRHLAQADENIARRLSSTRIRLYTLLSPLAQIAIFFSSHPRRRRRSRKGKIVTNTKS